MNTPDAASERYDEARQSAFEVEASSISSAGEEQQASPMPPARTAGLSPRARTRRVIIAASVLLLAAMVMVGSISSIRNRALALIVGPTPSAALPPTATLLPTFPPLPTSTPILPPQPLGTVPQNCQPGMAPQVFDPNDFGPGIGGGPLWVTGFEGPRATLALDPSPQNYSTYGWGATIIVALDTTQPLTATLEGTSVNTGFPLWFAFSFLFQGPRMGLEFSADHASQHSDGQWASWIGYLSIPAAGCYRLKATWPGGQWQVNFAAGRAGA